MALALPVMLIMISGLIEFGFALNQYLNTLDAAREAARYATDSDPLDRDFLDDGADPPNNFLPLVTNQDCGSTLDFYMQAACIAQQTMSPVDFNPATDDVVISVFRVLSGTVIDRWPNCEPDSSEDCPVDPPPFPETMGEWHLFGRGNGCGNGIDDDGDHEIDDGCPGGPEAVGDPEFCSPATDTTCHPSRLTRAQVEAKLEADAPDSAVLLVEVFYAYPHVMQLPWITPFVPNPLPLHTYTILPLPAAEPSLTVTGTVAMTNGTLLSGVTINFGNGMIAITDSDGMYLRTGLPSGPMTWTVDLNGTDCSQKTPNEYSEFLGTENMYDMNFVLGDCIDVAATNAAATVTSEWLTNEAGTNVAGTATGVSETATAGAPQTETAAAEPTVPEGETAVPTETATTAVGCSDTTVSPHFSHVTTTDPNPPRVQADGNETVTVLVELFNECNTTDNMADRTVTLSSSRGGTDTILPASAQTDGAGQAVFTVRSSTMSDWNAGSHTFSNSTFTATGDGVVINNTSPGAFMCVGGETGSGSGGTEVVWRFTNDTGIDRRLTQLDVSWSQPEHPDQKLTGIYFGDGSGTLVWSSASFFFNPGTIDTNWLGVPDDRRLSAGSASNLRLVFDFSVTGNQSFTVTAHWDNTTGASFCTSSSVTVHLN